MSWTGVMFGLVAFVLGRASRGAIARRDAEIAILKAERADLQAQRNELVAHLHQAEAMGHAVDAMRARGLEVFHFARPIAVSPTRRPN